MKRVRRNACRNGSAIAVIAMIIAGGSPAFGQTTDETAAEGAIPDIIVTAERRSESLQKSSVSLQVVGAAELERSNLTQASDLNTIVPGVQIGTGGNAPQIYIRGVGDFAASALSNSAVAVNIDGVYVARPQAVNSLFYDLERVEVLKGPQGTLYGRNASGGALNLVSTRPRLGKLSGSASLTFGNYDTRQLEAAVNVPLGDTLAVRVAGTIVDRDGYLSDGTDDDKRQAGRVRLLWEPSSAVSLLLNADVAHEGGRGAGYVQLPRPAGTNPWTSASSPQANAALAASPIGFLIPPVQADSYRNNDFWNVSAELNVDLGFATFTFLPTYRHANMTERNYPAGLRNTIPDSSAKQTSIEARLGHDTGNLKWVLGGYFFDERQFARQQIYQGILQDTDGFYSPNTRSYAAFGQATWSATDRFRLIGGLRYTYERRTLTGEMYTNSPNGLPPGTPLPALVTRFGGQDSFDSWTWRAGAEFDLAPRNMLYATASTGFKAGGSNQTVAPDESYAPERITAFQLGARNQFLDGKLRVNLEAFWWEVRDGQIAHVKFDPLGNVNLITDNAGKARIRGANVDLQAALTRNDTLRLFVEYNDATYQTFRYDTAYSIFGTVLFNPLSTGCPVGKPIPGSAFGTTKISVDCSGNQMPRAPRWSGSASYTHTFDLANGGMVVTNLASQLTSSRWLGFEYVPTQRVSTNVTFDADLTYTPRSGNWSVSVYGRNLSKEAVYTGGGVHSFAPPLVYATIAPPRTYGVRLKVMFDR